MKEICYSDLTVKCIISKYLYFVYPVFQKKVILWNCTNKLKKTDAKKQANPRKSKNCACQNSDQINAYHRLYSKEKKSLIRRPDKCGIKNSPACKTCDKAQFFFHEYNKQYKCANRQNPCHSCRLFHILITCPAFFSKIY